MMAAGNDTTKDAGREALGPDEGYADPHSTLAPHTFAVPGSEVRTTFYESCNDALNGAVAAETLGFGWRLDAYDAPISDDSEVREWRLVVWREYVSDAALGPHDAASGSEEGE